MINIKTTISFDEFNAIVDKVVNDCFPDGTYSPANYKISLRTGLLCAFAPDFDLSGCEDNNALWERVWSEEARQILNEVYNQSLYDYIVYTINKAIDYRIKILASGSMSMSDMALSKLFEVITEKVDKIDTSVLSQENINAVAEAVNKSKDGNFAESLVDVMLDRGMLAKPNRKTRRKNGQRIQNTDKPNIAMTSSKGSDA